jgi:hypothetical protein
MCARGKTHDVAVVVLNFVKKGTHERGGAKANIKYIEMRRGKDGAKIQRPLFTTTGQVTRLQAYEMVNQAAEGSTFFRIKISPDPVKEDVSDDLLLQEITAKTLDIAEKTGKQISWVAAIHDDHTDKRHIHVLAVTKARKLPAMDMIRRATDACVEQRKELDKARQPEREQKEEGRIWERERSK